MTEKNNSDFPSSSAHVSRYNIQENVSLLGLCTRNWVGARSHRPHTSSYLRNRISTILGNWSLMFASISGQMALDSSFSSHFGPHLPSLFKLH